jgi:uncharacterized membrane protein YuzA (DUF378 family)
MVLAIIGGLNWGLVGVGMFMSSNWNVVNLIFGNWMWLEAVVYILVGLSALALIFLGKGKKAEENPMM